MHGLRATDGAAEPRADLQKPQDRPIVLAVKQVDDQRRGHRPTSAKAEAVNHDMAPQQEPLSGMVQGHQQERPHNGQAIGQTDRRHASDAIRQGAKDDAAGEAKGPQAAEGKGRPQPDRPLYQRARVGETKTTGEPLSLMA